MTSIPNHKRLAVCTWSLLPVGPIDLVARLHATGITRAQLALDPLRGDPAVWGDTKSLLADHGIEIVSGMFGCVGEDYATLESIRATGGIAPDATWGENLRNIRATAELASKLGLKLVTFHAGFLPSDESDPEFEKMLMRLKTVAEVFAAAGMDLALETGQESALSLQAILLGLNAPNLFVNFDPANMILYGKGDPVQSVGVLGRWIRQVHIKDATRAVTPGTWGEEVAVGSGDVDWPRFFAALEDIDFTGDWVIEREAGIDRIADILTAKQLVLESTR
ncbi:MAG: sugar phosphate isomerase/epimerase family protein [Luteolibacter sp.]|jgi:sugar phosphate isomerase/epimerase|nr:sugar phosphate isomerase/epimerase family protein [Luteolibacter sp.]